MDVFELEWAQGPEISPQGNHVVYRRMSFDVMRDKRRGNLWMVSSDGTEHRKLSSFDGNESGAIWSPDGLQIAYLRDADDEGTEIFILSVSHGTHARVTRLSGKPKDLAFSPDGSSLAFTMTVETPPPTLGSRPPKPEGASWSESPRVTDRLYHEKDGSGYIKPGFSHVFLVPTEGGSARQLTHGNYHHYQPSWSPDGRRVLVSGNLSPDWEYDYRNSELYSIDVASGEIQAVTSQDGPDTHPRLSPDGRHLAWLGYTDKKQAYQLTRLRLAAADGNERIELLEELDRSISAFRWAADSSGLFVQYDDQGRTKIGFVTLDGQLSLVADNLGGTSIGRPYGGGSFSVAGDGRIAYTFTRPEFPADIVVVGNGRQQLTHLNRDLLDFRKLGVTEEIRWKSSFDQREIQGWLLKPPGFDPDNTYPLLVENHGGPISNYGERFSPEMQLYAAAGYVVLLPNPRGSTGYGEEFGNLLYHNYPGQDYDDVMSGVDAALALGYIDPERLYVTGGSAGGIMTAWMIAKNDRFKAAAVVKPVMNWYSKTLNADNWFQYYHTRYPGTPWTNPEDYMRFSPISLVENVNTPTLVMVGLSDLRTPPSQAKQLYHALKYRRVDTALVELPGASHFIAKTPSQMIDKISAILAWFERYATDE
ncbi:MAG: S9 family peptidase [Congregibacter sp.]